MATRPSKKLSRRQREERQQMRRWMIFGGGAFAAVASASVGITLLPPDFPNIGGEGSMSQRISTSGLGDWLMQLTPGPATLLAIGTTDCVHCRAFVTDGLEETVKFAQEEGIGFIYAPTGSSLSSLRSTRLINGLARSGVADSEAIQAVYTSSSLLGDEEGLSKVARNIGDRFGLSEEQVDEILTESDLEVTKRIQTLGQTFPIPSTPTFFVQSMQSADRINWFSGWPGIGALKRQVKFAREV